MNIVPPRPSCRDAPAVPYSRHAKAVAGRVSQCDHGHWASVVAVLAVLLWPLSTAGSAAEAAGWPWPSETSGGGSQPHPAVVRVMVDEPHGISQGSGTLVDVRDQIGLVVTNWHVVRDASGPIHVLFPDGFRSAARVLRVDRDWDLAALVIWRPHVSPVPLASAAPRPGEPLTIAGYGPGPYRAASGHCTQYVAPSDRHPFEMVEVSATARQGDSGGPIFNQSGELAGVLFGSGGGTTSGSYAGRVREFLSTAWPPEIPSDNQQAIAAATTRQPEPPAPLRPIPQDATSQPNAEVAQLAPLPSSQSRSDDGFNASSTGQVAPSQDDLPQVRTGTFSWQDLAGETTYDQLRSILALVGAFAIFVQITKLTQPRPPR